MRNKEKFKENSLHKQFIEYGANAKKWTRKCVLLLPEIERHRVWKKKGFSSIYEYAAKLAGMSHNTVDDALRILRKIEDKPALRKVVEEKGIGAVRPIVTIATQETAGFWAEKAREMSKNTLEVYIQEFRGLSRPRTKSEPVKDPSAPAAAAEKVSISMDLDPEIADKLEKLKGQGDWNTLMKKLLEPREPKPIPIETNSRYIPAKIKHHITAQTGKTCAFPGCKRPYKILHHTERFALYQKHDPDKIIPLCKAHEQIAHHGLIGNENLAPEKWKIRKHADAENPKHYIDQVVRCYYGLS